MEIEHYSFGNIVINGKTYTKDVIIFPERVFSPWWRKEGHLLHKEDLTEVIGEKPDILVIGQGYSGVMEVPQNLIDELRGMGIEVTVSNTKEAVTTFNNLKGKRVIAAFHLTC